jgi:hypothetical protein
MFLAVDDGTIVICAYGESGSHVLAIDDDRGFCGCTRRGWLGVRVLDCRLDLAKVAALDGSGSLLSCVPPSVLDLDKLGTGGNLTVDVSRELDLIAGSGEALVAISYVRKEGSVVQVPCCAFPWQQHHRLPFSSGDENCLS